MNGPHRRTSSTNSIKSSTSTSTRAPCPRTQSARSISHQKTMACAKIGGGGYKVFCNPPYGSNIKHWVKKCHDEAQKGTLVVMLIPARTDTSYFHDYIYHKAEIRFIRGRLKFGNADQGAPFPSMVVVFNSKTE